MKIVIGGDRRAAPGRSIGWGTRRFGRRQPLV